MQTFGPRIWVLIESFKFKEIYEISLNYLEIMFGKLSLWYRLGDRNPDLWLRSPECCRLSHRDFQLVCSRLVNLNEAVHLFFMRLLGQNLIFCFLGNV